MPLRISQERNAADREAEKRNAEKSPAQYGRLLDRARPTPAHLLYVEAFRDPRLLVRAARRLRRRAAVWPGRRTRRTGCGGADDRTALCHAMRRALAVSVDRHARRAGDPLGLAGIRRRLAAGDRGGNEKGAGQEGQSHAEEPFMNVSALHALTPEGRPWLLGRPLRPNDGCSSRQSRPFHPGHGSRSGDLPDNSAPIIRQPTPHGQRSPRPNASIISKQPA